ncbi:unnamed protein product [Malus baccata var. baccata]
MRPRCLDTCVAVGFALDIARAMECLHSHGIIHRDLKPENLILTADQKTVKLADFGLAREESLTKMMTAETGTYRWMSPEIRGLKESDVDNFVDDVLVNHKPWASRVQEPLTGSHVFVCAHCSREEWNRDSARVLIDKFEEEAELRGWTNQVFVTACYHTGGHNGNLIIYIPGSDGSTTGHWYGYVTPDDVPELLDQHIGKGEIIERLWRGQIGASCDEAEKINDPKLPNGGESKKIEEKPQGNGNWIENNENFSGCCQSSRVWSRSSSTADLCKHLLRQPQWCCTRPRAGLREH